jgi:Flp pilus assembly pilin Flp
MRTTTNAVRGWLVGRFGPDEDEGNASVEYALLTVVAAGLAYLLYQIVTSSEVSGWLTGLLQHAMSVLP